MSSTLSKFFSLLGRLWPHDGSKCQEASFLQTVPGQPASGAIYLYDRQRQIFFFAEFVDGRDDSLTAEEFDHLVTEYDLTSWTANPAFLSMGLTHGTA